jgi:thiamine phosphate synthase YjbQ (UPF0047 family)
VNVGWWDKPTIFDSLSAGPVAHSHSHLRATLLGPSLTVPIADGKPVLGAWQRISVSNAMFAGAHARSW